MATHYFTSSSTAMTQSSCLPVLLHMSKKPHVQTSSNLLWSSCDDNAICYVFPVLRMTSRFHITGHTVHGIGNINVAAMLQQSQNSNVFATEHHALWLCNHLQWQQTAHLQLSLIYDCFVYKVLNCYIISGTKQLSQTVLRRTTELQVWRHNHYTYLIHITEKTDLLYHKLL